MKAQRALPAHVAALVAQAQGKPEPKREPQRRRGVMNATEFEYSRELAARWQRHELIWFAFEPFALRLARGASFTPDFVVLTDKGHLQFHEVKGHWREAARVRIKVAASKFPFPFFVVQKTRDGWSVEEIRK